MKKIGIEVADKNFRLIKVLYNKKNTRIIIPKGTPKYMPCRAGGLCPIRYVIRRSYHYFTSIRKEMSKKQEENIDRIL